MCTDAMPPTIKITSGITLQQVEILFIFYKKTPNKFITMSKEMVATSINFFRKLLPSKLNALESILDNVTTITAHAMPCIIYFKKPTSNPTNGPQAFLAYTYAAPFLEKN